MATTIQFLRSDIAQQRPNPGVLANGTPMVNLNEQEPGLFFAARDGSLFKVGPTSIGDQAPNSSPAGEIGNSLGEMWLDTSGLSPQLKIFDGSNWVNSSSDLGGTVTSVGLSFSDLFTVAGSPVSTSGTLSASLISQNSNQVFAGPAAGPAATPNFRALVDSDIPILNASKITSGVFDSGRIPSLDASKIVSGTFSTARIPTLDANAVNFALNVTGAITRSVEAKLQDYVDVRDFGATGDGSTDDTIAIQSAINSGAKLVYFPAGIYRTTSTLTISSSGIGLVGDGIGEGLGLGATDGSIIIMDGTGPVISVAISLTGVNIRNLHITRSGAVPVPGDDGIEFDTYTEQAILENVLVSGCWVGLQLSTTSYSFVTQCIARDNYSHGIRVANVAGINGLQWQFLKNLLQTNDGYGLFIDTSNGTGPASVGDIIMTATYANKLGGMWFVGTPISPINSVRLGDCFVGEDGNHGLYFDTYNSTTHKVDATFVEITGTSACGVGLSTPAPNVGNGIHVTTNNGPINITNCIVLQNSFTGIYMAASRYLISGCEIRLNGFAGVAGEMNGVESAQLSATTRGSIVSCSIKGHTDYGIYSVGDNIHVSGNDLRENGLDAINFASGYINSTVIGNQGSSVINTTAPLQRNGVQILSTRQTGWVGMTGTADSSSAFNTGTVALQDLAERVKAIQDALTTHGLIGT